MFLVPYVHATKVIYDKIIASSESLPDQFDDVATLMRLLEENVSVTPKYLHAYHSPIIAGASMTVKELKQARDLASIVYFNLQDHSDLMLYFSRALLALSAITFDPKTRDDLLSGTRENQDNLAKCSNLLQDLSSYSRDGFSMMDNIINVHGRYPEYES